LAKHLLGKAIVTLLAHSILALKHSNSQCLFFFSTKRR
jgi:hypothetical protein